MNEYVNIYFITVGDKVTAPKRYPNEVFVVTKLFPNDTYGVEDAGGFYHLFVGDEVRPA
jgi:hypothetical protein